MIHQFRNESSAPARAFVIAAPAGVEGLFAAAGEPVAEGSRQAHPPSPEEIARLTELAPRWGVTIAS